MGNRGRVGALTARGEHGGAILLVALFLPVCMLSAGLVLDLGFAFTVKETAQAACDLGALAAVQELDWEKLAEGIVSIDGASARRQALDVTLANLASLVRKGLISEPVVFVEVTNPPAGEGVSSEPAVAVEVRLTVRTFFIRGLPGFGTGIPVRARAEARCVERTRW